MDFWFSIGSTYTYLSVMRMDRIEEALGSAVSWQPFDVRVITTEMNNSPFRGKPVKLAYMWRDVERRAARHGVPFNGIPPYGLKDLARVNRVAVTAFSQGWGTAFVRAAYRHWFLQLEDVSEEPVLASVIAALGKDSSAILAAADAPSAHKALGDQTQAARELGIFGSPTFAVGREIFWGDDRADDAVDWARNAERPSESR